MPLDNPEFTPGGLRGWLEEVSGMLARIETNLCDGQCKSHEEYTALVGERRGLLKARTAMQRRLDTDTVQRLGLKP